MKEAIFTIDAPKAIGPYSQAIKASGFVFVSGQLPINPQNEEIISDVRQATRQVLTNINNILKSAGSSIDRAVKITIYLLNMKDFSLVNEVYGEFFHNPYPARVCVEVKDLPKKAIIEIDCIALE